MDRETLFNWLAIAECHLVEGACQLLQQRELLSRLQTQGKSATTGMARELLDAMERVQALHIAHRDRLMAAIWRYDRNRRCKATAAAKTRIGLIAVLLGDQAPDAALSGVTAVENEK
jgi:hypothetical protein